MWRSLGRVARRRPRTVALVLALSLLAGIPLGLYGYALHQWRAAQTDLEEERPAAAREHLAFCLKVWPRSFPVHLLAARAARLNGDFPAAEAHLNRCLELDKDQRDAVRLEFLLMRVQRGEVDEVAPLLLDAVTKDHPRSAMILETLTGAYMRHLRYGPALNCLSRWIELEPDSARPFHWRGWIRERMNNQKGAMKDYTRALELNPDLFQVRLRVAEIWLHEANPPKALPHLLRLHRQYPDRPVVLARLGQCRLLQGKRKEARPLLEAAVKEQPNDPVLLTQLGKLEMEEDRPAKAEEWIRRALKVDPSDPEAQYTLVRALRAQGHDREAAAALQRHQTSQARLTRASKLLYDEAGHPTTDPDVPFEIGSVLLDIGQDKTGLYWLHQALERDPDHQPTHRVLAEYYEKKGDSRKAAEHRRRLREPDTSGGGSTSRTVPGAEGQ
jgi:predicted Zn-dependent protease